MKQSIKKKKIWVVLLSLFCFGLVSCGGLLFMFKTTGTINPKDFLKARFPNFYSKIRKAIILKWDREIPGIRKKMDLPFFQLVLSKNDIEHFSDLYKKYEHPQYGFRYYAKNNTWRKAMLLYKGKIYKVKVKAHGRLPQGHDFGKFISYDIKLEKGEQINRTRGFSLIIWERIPPFRYCLVPDLAQCFNLLIQKEELVSVRINNGEEKLYFFETEFNNDYMESIGKSSLCRFGYAFSPYDSTDKSMVYTGIDSHKSEFNVEEFCAQFQEIFEKKGVPESYRKAIYDNYLALNLAITEGKYQEIDRYFDLDYISSLAAARAIGGFNAHGFTRGNFYVFYDTANGKFYPGLHRDFFPSYLESLDKGTVEQQISDWTHPSGVEVREIPLLHLFAQNDIIRQEKYKKIYRFIIEQGDALITRQRQTVESCEKVRCFNWLKWTLCHWGMQIAAPYKDYAGNNMKVLKSYLEESAPKMTLTASNHELMLELLPCSVAAIRFDDLVFKRCLSSLGSERIKFRMVSFGPEGAMNVIEKECNVLSDAEGIHLAGVTSDLQFSTAIGHELQRVPRKYVLIFRFDKEIPEDIALEDLETSFMNIVTGKKIILENITLSEREKDFESLWAMPAYTDKSAYIEWRKCNEHLRCTRTPGNELILHSGTYRLEDDLIIPKDLKLIIEAGTTLLLGENKALACYRGIEIRGTAKAPVVITSVDPQKPFGAVGVLGDENTHVDICYLHLSNGWERWVDGVYFSGGLSLHHNGEVHLSNSIISANHADDGLNIKCSSVVIENSIFEDNFADQVDLDYCTGSVVNSQFSTRELSNNNGDGLDVSGSQVLVKNSRFTGFKDKGISIGEESDALVYCNTFQNNTCAVTVKDLSNAYFIQNAFVQNSVDISAYQKKDIFGGASIYLGVREKEDNHLKYSCDKKSSLNCFSSNMIVKRLKSSIEDLDISTIFCDLKKIKFRRQSD